jgi:hypothetical protein
MSTNRAAIPPVDWDEWEYAVRDAIGSARALTGLLGLHGVAYPSATALLCISNPQAFPVIDRWTVLAVFEGISRPDRAYFGAGYRAFAERLSKLSRAHFGRRSIQETDQLVMRLAMSGADGGFERIPLPLRSA